MTIEQIAHLLNQQLPDYQLVSATPLTGGLSNRCWKVTLRHRQSHYLTPLVWRPTSAATNAFGLSREHEYRLLHALGRSENLKTGQALSSDSRDVLSGKAIAPAAFALLPEGLLVEWVEGQLAAENLPLAALAAIQAHIHQLPVPDWRLDCPERARHYWHHIPSEAKSPALRAIHHHFQTHPPIQWFADVCCHHDLGWYNIIISGTSETGGLADARVIDWEYAAAGDPSLDLALTISANGLELQSAVHAYCQARALSRTEETRWLQAVHAWLPWCQYLALLWFRVAEALWQEPEYGKEADKLMAVLTPVVSRHPD